MIEYVAHLPEHFARPGRVNKWCYLLRPCRLPHSQKPQSLIDYGFPWPIWKNKENMILSLNGKVSIGYPGGGSGIGKKPSRNDLQQGARVLIVRSTQKRADETVQNIKSTKGFQKRSRNVSNQPTLRLSRGAIAKAEGIWNYVNRAGSQPGCKT